MAFLLRKWLKMVKNTIFDYKILKNGIFIKKNGLKMAKKTIFYYKIVKKTGWPCRLLHKLTAYKF